MTPVRAVTYSVLSVLPCGVTVSMFIFLVFTGMSIVPVDSDTNDDKGEKEEQVQDDEVQDWGHLRFIRKYLLICPHMSIHTLTCLCVAKNTKTPTPTTTYIRACCHCFGICSRTMSVSPKTATHRNTVARSTSKHMICCIILTFYFIRK